MSEEMNMQGVIKLLKNYYSYDINYLNTSLYAIETLKAIAYLESLDKQKGCDGCSNKYENGKFGIDCVTCIRWKSPTVYDNYAPKEATE